MFYFYFSFFEHIFNRSRVRYSFKNPKISFFHKKIFQAEWEWR